MGLPIIDDIRRNHALEHASIAILLARLGTQIRLVGRSTASGFYIYGNLPTEEIESATIEALRRLQNGEAELAVSPLCGTNLAVAGALAGLSSAAVIGNRRRSEQIGNVILAATAALVAAQPIGRLVQTHLTTNPDLSGVRYAGISRTQIGPLTIHKVDTIQGA